MADQSTGTDWNCRRLEGKKIVVAGGAGAVGAGICTRLLAEGARVVAADRNQESLDAFVSGSDSDDTQLRGIQMDLSDANSISAGMDSAVNWLGGLNAAVFAVGISHQGTSFDDESIEGWSEVLSVNLTGAFAFAKSAVPAMDNGGAIVNISSGGAEMGLPLNIAYGASKGGLRNLTLGLSAALAPRGIRVNTVGPGLMEFPVRNAQNEVEARVGRADAVPLGRLGTGADIGAAVAYLVSSDAGWISGQNLYVDGGSLAGR